jgi:hypothetical protein
MPRPKSLLTDQQRFMLHVEKTETCWNWTGALRGHHKKGGYGTFSLDNKQWISSRASYTLFKGKIPEGLFVLHSCDNRLCVNPEHLRTGTHQENMDDMKARGRQANQNGENHGNNKLMDCDILEMLVLHGFGFTNIELSKQFKISDGMVSMIVNRKRWKHISF